MIKACRSDLQIDPILTLPMTRKERRRLLRWRMNWLPGGRPQCYCGGVMSRNHILNCPAIPTPYWDQIQRGTVNDVNPIDAILKLLPSEKPKTPTKKQQQIQKWQPYGLTYSISSLLLTKYVTSRKNPSKTNLIQESHSTSGLQTNIKTKSTKKNKNKKKKKRKII
ncbi:uncharacterized protein B0P05DRAFT_131121 [Gilbertella persicaria]|uniref:uncharacterized protein n=1 Tax=Gilbertella persicaria TaxID=101096 RepID=UPI00221FD406|nr:uncharacterized protein B0P05DRAFT_131121 [Gilbertella persicaria]KAI8077405.1 hypothetical protein B0P05DRAFT_131121 [Gilbertella persicaria]